MDWRKLVCLTGVDLRGKQVYWEKIGGEAGRLLQQLNDPFQRQRQLSRSVSMEASINAHTGLGGMISDHASILSSRKNYLQFVCADSRVLPNEINTDEHFIISVPIAGESLGGAFSYKQIVDLLPCLDGIIVEGHTNCGACHAANAAREGKAFDGSLQELTRNVEGDIDANLDRQIHHLIKYIGGELLRQYQVVVLGVKNNILAPSGKSRYELIDSTISLNDSSLPKIREAIKVYTDIIDRPSHDRFLPAPQTQEPTVLWMSGMTIFGQFRRGIGSVHQWVNEHRKGLIFKVLWQNPHDASTIASARYILDVGNSIKQIVFTAFSERDLWWDIESFVNNPELAAYMIQNPETELIGLVIDDNGLCATDMAVIMRTAQAVEI